MPVASRAVLDLSAWTPETDGPVRLDGEWALYWNQLLSPEALRSPAAPQPSGHLALPSAWNRFDVDGRAVGSVGCATLRLQVLPGPHPRRLALRLFNVNAAYSLFVDGKPLARSGAVSESALGEVARPADDLVAFQTEGRPFELVLQISNHAYREAGVLASLELGSEQRMEDARARRLGAAFFFIGCLLAMGLYHLVLFWHRRSNAALAWFAAYCLLWAFNYGFSETSGWAMCRLLPEIPSRVLDGFSMACFFVSVPAGYQFFRAMYPAEFSPRLSRPTAALAAIFVGLALAAPARPFALAQPAFYAVSALLIAYCLAALVRALSNRRDGAAFILVGFLVLGAGGLNDMLKDVQVLGTAYLLPVGMLVFVLSQAFALAAQSSASFVAVERLSAELAGKNRALEAEMAARTALEREIVQTSEAERRRLSYALHDGLCQLLTAARLRCSALGPSPDAQDLTRLSALLDEATGQAYDLSRGLWPDEGARETDGPPLEELVRRFAASSGLAVDCRIEDGLAAASPDLRAQLHRIAQEALVNVAKHARARRIELSLRAGPAGSLTLTVRDDGIGRAAANVSKGGLGLRFMAHRARMVGGTLVVADAEGGGTVVTCTVPIEEPSPAADTRAAPTTIGDR